MNHTQSVIIWIIAPIVCILLGIVGAIGYSYGASNNRLNSVLVETLYDCDSAHQSATFTLSTSTPEGYYSYLLSCPTKYMSAGAVIK